MDRESVALRSLAFLAFAALLVGATVVAYQSIGPATAGPQVTPVTQQRTTAPGSTVAFPIAVNNTGASDATVTLQAPDDTDLDVIPPDPVTVPVGEATVTFVTVNVPEGTTPGTHEVVVEATLGDKVRSVALEVVVEEPTTTVQEGDTVDVLYTGRLADGTVFGTNVAAVDASPIARTDFYTANEPFQPLTVPTAPGGGFIEGFRAGVIGVGLNHSTTVTVAPSDGFGNATIEDTRPREETLDRNASFQRVFNASRQAFGNLLNASSQEGDIVEAPLGSELFPFRIEHLNATHASLVLDVEVGDRLNPPEFQRFGANVSEVVAVNETEVTFRATPPVGEPLTYHDYWTNATEVVELNPDTLVLRHTPEEGSTFDESRGRSTVTWTVTSVGPDEIVITRPNSSPLAGLTTIFDITVVGIQQG